VSYSVYKPRNDDHANRNKYGKLDRIPVSNAIGRVLLPTFLSPSVSPISLNGDVINTIGPSILAAKTIPTINC
jgi:hypothetical protein